MKKIIFGLAAVLFVLPLSVSATTCATYDAVWEGGEFAFGKVTARNKIAQCFTVASSCTVGQVAVTIDKGGTPTDTATVSLYTSSAGNPDALIETGSALSVPTTMAEATSTFAGTTTLAPATTYCLLLYRSGATSDTNYYWWGVNTTGAPYSNILTYNAGWSSLGGGYNGLFRITAAEAGGGGETVGTSTPYTATLQEQLFIFGLFVFLVSVPFWDKVFSVTRGNYA